MKVSDADTGSGKPFDINWKMTAKTILVQLHHKIQTFEHLNKHLVLVLQDCLLDYVRKEFDFSHISKNPKLGDAMHFHAYTFAQDNQQKHTISLKERYSTDSLGIAKCLGLQAEPQVELEKIVKVLEQKISQNTLLQIV